jgi:hypothetical protein
MKKTLLLIGGLLLLLGTACTPGLQMLVEVLPGHGAPLGGAVAALPTSDGPTSTPAISAVSFPTPTPASNTAANSPLAALTQIAQIAPTQDLSATPYIIALAGRPHFVEFHAWW